MTVRPEEVRQMFDRISPGYDLMNRLMTAGLDGRWRSGRSTPRGWAPATPRSTPAAEPAIWRSSCAAAWARRAASSASTSRSRCSRSPARKSAGVEWRQGDALALPFADGEFAAATVGWGIRNLSDRERGFAELARVVRPGGRVVCLEMSTPAGWAARPAAVWTDHGVPVIGRLVTRRLGGLPLPARLGPPLPGCAGAGRDHARRRTRDIGFRRLMLGVVAIHVGTVP